MRHHENNQKRVEKKKKLDDRAKREEETYREQTKLAHEKIMKKKEDFKREDEILTKKAREIKLKKQYLKANQAKVEEQAWKNQEDGAEREIKERQNDSLINQERLLSIKLVSVTLSPKFSHRKKDKFWQRLQKMSLPRPWKTRRSTMRGALKRSVSTNC